MNKIELLSPAGDFECLKAAVQNGADAVYLGLSNFSARASAKNFNLEELKDAISYAKLRGVKVHLAFNTLIKNTEFNTALELISDCYKLGIDAIIVQDYGLCAFLKKHLPDLPIHASTQMSIHNLEGVKELEELGFSRVVLSRELSISELEFIKNNTNIELEVFTHGALCICYSGQCLISSMIGGRSGNRGKCAQACRLPYELIVKSNKEICMDKGFILSPKDLCGLSYIPNFINMGITSLKIEGRMKNPEYVATVTRIYRKYIDLAYSKKDFIIDEKDQKDLLQVFNRGGFSDGHLSIEPNRNFIFKDKPNNMGIYVGNVARYSPIKGHITLNLNDRISIGDTITFEKEPTKYHISELMIDNQNVQIAENNQLVTIGRMKGNIQPGDKIYKLESKTLLKSALASCNSENKKVGLNCKLCIEKNKPVHVKIESLDKLILSKDYKINILDATNQPITTERIVTQFNKTGNTPYYFKKLDINLAPNIYINISDVNELRRNILQEVDDILKSSYQRKLKKNLPLVAYNKVAKTHLNTKYSLLLNTLDLNANYQELEHVDRIYIPIKYFSKSEYANVLNDITSNFDTYIYMPSIIKPNYRNVFTNNITSALENYPIKGFVVSNMGTLKILENYKQDYKFIGNYTLNVFNNVAINNYLKLGLNEITLSPELNKQDIAEILDTTLAKTELMVYGRLPIMTLGYCVLGKSNRCYPNCNSLCESKHQYYLKDRMGLYFPVFADNTQTINTIYNSKITSIDYSDLNVTSVRIDILEESFDEINEIIRKVKSKEKLEGKNYTNGNFVRNV